jgi:hypothetical protein
MASAPNVDAREAFETLREERFNSHGLTCPACGSALREQASAGSRAGGCDRPHADPALTRLQPCSPFVLMEHAPESMRNGAEPLSQTRQLIAEILPELRPSDMQTVYFQCIEDGPESLLAPIEAEFAKRGLSTFAMVLIDGERHHRRTYRGPDRAGSRLGSGGTYGAAGAVEGRRTTRDRSARLQRPLPASRCRDGAAPSAAMTLMDGCSFARRDTYVRRNA